MVRANGVLARVGQVCQTTTGYSNLYLCDKTLRLRPSPGLRSDFMALALLTPQSRREIESLTSGSDMRNISQTAIREITIPVPSPEVQAEHATRINATKSAADCLADEVTALRALRAQLLQTLLSREVEIPESYDELLAGVA
jgi:type I restriction enzyme S subunit